MGVSLEDALEAWHTGLSVDQEEQWNRDVRDALGVRIADGCREAVIGRRPSWALLGWCENATSTAVRSQDSHLLELVTIALSLLSSRHIDHREVLLVGALVRRAVELLGLHWGEFRRRFASDGPVLELLDKFPEAVSAKSHREQGSGREFRFVKVRLASMSEDELLRRLGET